MKKHLIANAIIKASALSLAALASLQVFAESSEKNKENNENEFIRATGFYIGGQLGHATTTTDDVDIDPLFQSAGINAASTSVDRKDMSYSLFLGYSFNDYISLELGYQDLGERTVYFSGTSTNPDAFFDLAEHIYPETGDGATLSVIGTIPFDNGWSLSGKLGYFDWELDSITEDKNVNSISGFVAKGDDQKDSSGIWYGAELGYHFDYDLQGYLSFQHFPLDEDDVNVISLGFRFWFDDLEPKKPLPLKKTVPAVKPLPIVVQKDSDNDGVMDNKDQCIDTPKTHLVNNLGCTMYVAKDIDKNVTILYANDSSKINSEFEDEVAELAAFIKRYDAKKVVIEGHTSAVGSEKYNMWLSERRASAVASMLVQKFGIKKDIIQTVGKGESEIISHIPRENRRIEAFISVTENVPMLRN